MCAGNFLAMIMLHKKYWPEYLITSSLDLGADLTVAGQFLISFRKDEFGPTEIQFNRKTQVILTSCIDLICASLMSVAFVKFLKM